MKKVTILLPEIVVVGMKARTNNKLEMDIATAKIPATTKKYFVLGWNEKNIYRKKPQRAYSVYTEYESDFTGDFTYFIGEEVTDVDKIPEGFSKIIIPSQKYVKFTNEVAGPMPKICIDMWQKIWQMTPEQFGGNRSYKADFELYDERAKNYPQDVIVDIFIGIEK